MANRRTKPAIPPLSIGGPMDGMRLVEQWAAGVWQHLPGAVSEHPTEVRQFRVGEGEDALTLLITAEAVEVRLPTIEWTAGSYAPAASSRFWRRVEWRGPGSIDLPALIVEAQAARQAEYKVCRYCGKSVPREHRLEDDVCHGCAEAHEGVMF